MKLCLRLVAWSFTGLLAACGSIATQVPIPHGQSVRLKPGDGIVALLMDTRDAVTQIRLVSSADQGPELNLPSMPAGHTLALFVAPAGVYCMKQFDYGRYMFFSEHGGIDCFQVTAGHISYSGNLQPSAGTDPETRREAAFTAQAYEPRQFLLMLTQQYPQLMAAYPTAGPSPASEGGEQNDTDQEVATWTVEAADRRSFDIYFRNNTNWLYKLSSFEFTTCSNIKQPCGAQAPGVALPPNTTVKFMTVQQADDTQRYEFRYNYNYARPDPDLKP